MEATISSAEGPDWLIPKWMESFIVCYLHQAQLLQDRNHASLFYCRAPRNKLKTWIKNKQVKDSFINQTVTQAMLVSLEIPVLLPAGDLLLPSPKEIQQWSWRKLMKLVLSPLRGLSSSHHPCVMPISTLCWAPQVGQLSLVVITAAGRIRETRRTSGT
jgi:hypothetical protein